MQKSQNNFAALIGSRICHDLISPLGAIGNGVELLTMLHEVDGPEIALINESVLNANARIRFFRISFGAALDDQIVSKAEVLSILQDIKHGSRIDVVWSIPNDVPRTHVKLAFLLLLCLETAMPYGGKVTVELADGRWILHANSERLKIDPDLWQMMISAKSISDISPAMVHFALAPEMARDLEKTLQVELKETEIVLVF